MKQWVAAELGRRRDKQSGGDELAWALLRAREEVMLRENKGRVNGSGLEAVWVPFHEDHGLQPGGEL